MVQDYNSQKPHQNVIEELDLMLRARYPLLYIVSVEEEPIDEILNLVADLSQPKRNVAIWDIVRGWDNNGGDKGSVMAALGRVGKADSNDNTLFVLRDLHFILKNPQSDRNAPVIREIKNLTKVKTQSQDINTYQSCVRDTRGVCRRSYGN